MKTTLSKIAVYGPCSSGWKKLLRGLGKQKADDEELALSAILDINGLTDAIWCFRAVDGFKDEKQLFAVFCARQVQHLCRDVAGRRELLDSAEVKITGAVVTFNLQPAAAAAAAAAASRLRMTKIQETELRRVLASLA